MTTETRLPEPKTDEQDSDLNLMESVGELLSDGVTGVDTAPNLETLLGNPNLTSLVREQHEGVLAYFKNLVNKDLSPSDSLFKGDLEDYLNITASALRPISNALLIADKQQVNSILDYGCGYGSITRGLRACFPQARIFAADEDSSAVDYCVETFSAEPVYFSSACEPIDLEEPVDLVWAGDMLNGLSQLKAKALLDALVDTLAPNGVLVFACLGRSAFSRQLIKNTEVGAEQMLALQQDYYYQGFGYLPMKSGQPDTSVCKPSWIVGHLESVPELRILFYTERGWYGHYDVVACARD